MTRLALIGYGKMGKMIESMAATMDCTVVSIIDPNHPGAHPVIDASSVADADVCIEFSHPSVVMDNIKALLELKKNIVVGTTGWNQHLDGVREMVDQTGTGFLWGANFSLGMNLFGRVVEYAAELIDRFESYDSYGFEMHHRQKADSPSGTAIELAQRVLKHSSRKDKAVYDRLDRRPEQNELHFASIRGGFVPGTHTIGFDSEADTIELVHRIRSRSALASGAIMAARWINGKRGFYTFSEMISEIIC